MGATMPQCGPCHPTTPIGWTVEDRLRGHKYATEHGRPPATARHCFERLLSTSRPSAPGATVEMANSALTGAELEEIVDDLYQITVGKYFFLAAAVVLYYDHLVTLPTEVQVIWKRNKTYVTYLFFLVRYYAPLAVAVVAFAYFSPSLTRKMCGKWMYFLPLGISMPLCIFPAMLMSIRIYALYNRNKVILAGLFVYLAMQTAAGLWQYTVPGATPAPLPLDNYEFHFCIYLPPKSIGRLSTMFVTMELVFDSIIFLLTVARTMYVHTRTAPPVPNAPRVYQKTSLVVSLARDGAFYFAAIFSVNLAWVIMILYAPTGLRAIASVPAGCIITTMMCRITLNLRATAYGPANLDERTGVPGTGSIALSTMRRQRTNYTTGEIEFEQQINEDDYYSDVGLAKVAFDLPDAEVNPGTTSSRIVEDLPFSSGNGYGDFPYAGETSTGLRTVTIGVAR
ncbi:unnamed protein product [Peniophora sp. CBMAI 1063]|nr:unnamed protein product [Peniophora sp. CBMAI 1063]